MFSNLAFNILAASHCNKFTQHAVVTGWVHSVNAQSEDSPFVSSSLIGLRFKVRAHQKKLAIIITISRGAIECVTIYTATLQLNDTHCCPYKVII